MRGRALRGVAIASVCVIGAACAVTVGASTSVAHRTVASRGSGKDLRKVKIKVDGRDLFFKGPKQIQKGEKLEVVNKTSPSKVGPHTFTLIKKNRLPKSKKNQKACERGELAVCNNGIKAHKVDFSVDPAAVNKPRVEVGRKGWDASFGKTGDSQFIPLAGEHHTRRVSADPGSTLYYFCLVHPFMQGKVKVVK